MVSYNGNYEYIVILFEDQHNINYYVLDAMNKKDMNPEITFIRVKSLPFY